MHPYHQDETALLFYGDALDVFRGLWTERPETPPVAAVCIDPPYASGARTEATKSRSGAMVRGQRWNARPIENDQMTTVGFVWFVRELLRLLVPRMVDGASLLCWIDWRQWPHLAGAVESCNLRLCNMLVWDKESFGLGNGFRVQHELILHAGKGTPRIFDRDVPNVLRHPRPSNDNHPSPKPVALCRDLLRVVTAPGDLVVEPCCGCGPYTLAARDLGRRAVACDVVAGYLDHLAGELRRMDRLQRLALLAAIHEMGTR